MPDRDIRVPVTPSAAASRSLPTAPPQHMPQTPEKARLSGPNPLRLNLPQFNRLGSLGNQDSNLNDLNCNPLKYLR
jgi:hypothetical protein